MVSLLERLEAPGPKRILALDGGGMRGIIALGMLEELERVLRERHQDPNLRLCDYFDLIGGTSTGAIIASMLALGYTAADVTEVYLRIGATAFRAHGWHFWRLMRSRFDDGALIEQLRATLGERTLEDSDLLSGLCIITKRADTGSTWRLLNHPQARYFEDNKGILLRDAVRASIAAPFFFAPAAITVTADEVGAFVDGGVSMANNPGLELFLVATLGGYPFKWARGADKLMLVSIGTGSWSTHDSPESVLRAHHLRGLRRTIEMLISDADWHGQTILQALSNSPTAWVVDSEVGDLKDDLIAETASLHYLRYNVVLEAPTLEALGFPADAARVRTLRDGFSGRERNALYAIGCAAGKEQVRPAHFPAAFDLPRPARVDSEVP